MHKIIYSFLSRGCYNLLPYGYSIGKIKNEIKILGGKNIMLNQLELPKDGEEIIEMKTNYGVIKIRLFPEGAPKAVENFKTHAKEGYYDGIIFHRVIEGFMIQGGDPTGTGTGGESIWGEPFEDECQKDYRHFKGALSMANAGPGTNGSQFFIVQNGEAGKNIIDQMSELGEEGGFPEAVVNAYTELGGTPHLDFRHTIFGQVVEGIDVVDKIASVETVTGDKPKEPVIMEKVQIVNY